MEDSNNDLLNKKQKEYLSIFIISISVFCFLNGVFFYILNNSIGAYSYWGAMCLAIYFFYFINKLKFDFSTLNHFGNISFTIYAYYNSLLFCKVTPIIYSWFFIIPIIYYLFHDFKRALYSAIAILILTLSVEFVSNLLTIRIDILLSNAEVNFINVGTIIWWLYFLLLHLYYHQEFSLAEKIMHEAENKKGVSPEETLTEKHLKLSSINLDDKTDELYKRIITYFEEQRPYSNAKFNIGQLAQAVNSNTNYVSKALNKGFDGNFNAFMNHYRIKDVTLRLNKLEFERYTLKSIYNSVGFEHQSTFNRVFKEIEGVTPTQYIESLKSNL